MALFERGPRKTPLVGKVVGIGLVDEISDHTWIVIDAMDGRAHYAELGRLKLADAPVRGTIVALAGGSLDGKPSPVPKVQVLSPVALEKQTTYDGPTWLDEAILSQWQPEQGTPGFAGQVRAALATRRDWLVDRRVATIAPGGDLRPTPDMMRTLRKAETERIVQQVSRELNAAYVPTAPGVRITGVYDHAITTPTGKLAVLRREDTFTLAPWRSALEPFTGRAVSGITGPNRVTWSLDRGRGLPSRS